MKTVEKRKGGREYTYIYRRGHTKAGGNGWNNTNKRNTKQGMDNSQVVHPQKNNTHNEKGSEEAEERRKKRVNTRGGKEEKKKRVVPCPQPPLRHLHRAFLLVPAG
ncbi:hypothetical protein M378DRAFT_545975 [Amanita muscaria Koide BX008]|uniref:Uncharacterized protein n=1 Tax=Amanita muscaria (strain Koide BX008) TaxID=946122 RepID=A0A0C2WTW1_AMAMK|nr:hypothetical protein M378DRAFT_545975 [Amanita muscaria Koide BX008]